MQFHWFCHEAVHIERKPYMFKNSEFELLYLLNKFPGYKSEEYQMIRVGIWNSIGSVPEHCLFICFL